MRPDLPHGFPEPVRLARLSAAGLPLLERLVRAYYAEDRHTFDAGRQPTALAALAADEPLGRAWLIELDGRPVGYVVLSWGFSVEAGGREACLDELYLVPEVRRRGLGRRVLMLVEAEARRSACAGFSSRSSAAIGRSGCIAAPATPSTIAF